MHIIPLQFSGLAIVIHSRSLGACDRRADAAF